MQVRRAKWSKVVVLGAVALVAVGLAAVRADAAGDLVAHWRLDDTAGSTALDATGNGNTGSVEGAVSVAGRVGSALRFDGVDDVVRVPATLSLQPAQVSVEAWVRRDGSPGIYRHIVAKGATDCVASSYALYTGPDGGLAFYISNGQKFTLSPDAGAGIWDGNWHRATGTFDGSTVRLYVDGREVGSGSPTSLAIRYDRATSTDLTIGAYKGSCADHDFSGDIDEVKVWNGALAASEIIDPDVTAPTIEPSLTGTPGTDGWYVSTVDLTWLVGDPESGLLATDGCEDAAVDSDTAGAAFTCSATNGAGLSSSESVSVKLDLTDPAVTCGSAPTFDLGQVGQRVAATVTDAGSGPAAASVSSAVVDTSTPGAGTASVTGSDRAGRTTTVACPYAVEYDFRGFYFPVRNLPAVNLVKAGFLVPIIFSVGGDRGTAILAPGAPTSVPIACSPHNPIAAVGESSTTGRIGLQYVRLFKVYLYVWKTSPSWAGTCRQFVLTLADGTRHRADFRFR